MDVSEDVPETTTNASGYTEYEYTLPIIGGDRGGGDSGVGGGDNSDTGGAPPKLESDKSDDSAYEDPHICIFYWSKNKVMDHSTGINMNVYEDVPKTTTAGSSDPKYDYTLPIIDADSEIGGSGGGGVGNGEIGDNSGSGRPLLKLESHKSDDSAYEDPQTCMSVDSEYADLQKLCCSKYKIMEHSTERNMNVSDDVPKTSTNASGCTEYEYTLPIVGGDRSGGGDSGNGGGDNGDIGRALPKLESHKTGDSVYEDPHTCTSVETKYADFQKFYCSNKLIELSPRISMDVYDDARKTTTTAFSDTEYEYTLPIIIGDSGGGCSGGGIGGDNSDSGEALPKLESHKSVDSAYEDPQTCMSVESEYADLCK
ncbi:uncharacterized protein LOC117106140 [Anneissia japonica]|uniref:uncharacterized protein LOC117106140 n=1 Tax=Anneissia japonica TaxID=1529436 RepID=UPI0014255254|nr:uncharacterized protein LOC117106140 [Anneissia japonica]